MSAYCPNAVLECEVEGPPVTGYNAELAWSPFEIGLGFGPATPPPLNWSFDNADCFTTYHSTVSQLDADDNAYLQSVQCSESQWTNPEGQMPVAPLPPPASQPEPLATEQPSDVYTGEIGGIDELPIF